jgi:F-type H+-transporting ATPase subunit a
MQKMIDIKLQSEYIGMVWGLLITNTFFTSVIVTGLLALLGFIFYIKRNNESSILVNVVRVVIYELLKLTDMVTEDRSLSKKVLPLVATFFLFIAGANLLALIPGFLGSFFINYNGEVVPLLRSPNSDLTTTLALAAYSTFAIQLFSIGALGVKGYAERFINLNGPIQFILGFFEMISEMVRVVSFSFRLFGNVFAGEVLLLIIAFLVPYIVPLPFMLLEMFVGIIQAFVFAMLTLTFVKTSTIVHRKTKIRY